MLAAIFVVPICLFVNAFLIGRFLKRIRISINSFLSTIIGFFSLLGILYIFDIVLYALNANMWVYLIIYSIIQLALIIGYIVNWRHFHITWSFDLKEFLTFIITFGLCFTICWFSQRELNSEFGTYWIKTIQNLPESISFTNPINFRTVENDIISQLSAINILNVYWINIFKITTFKKCYTFCWWCWTLCGCGIIACLTTWIVPKNCHIARVILSPFIVLVYITMILAFIENFAIVDSWLMIAFLIFVLIMLKQTGDQRLKLFFLTVMMMGFIAISSTAYYVTICSWLFAIYWAIRNKENTINYIVCLGWPLLLSIFGISSISTIWLLPTIDILLIISMCVTLGLFIRRGAPAWSTKFARVLSRDSRKIVYTCLALIIAIVIVVNIFIFNDAYKWKAENIHYENFLTFTYRYIWTFPIKKDESIAIFNSILYAFFLALILWFIITRNVKKSKLYPITKHDSAIKLAVTTAGIFINPLFIHILKYASEKMAVSMTINTLDLNIMFIAPLFVALLRLNYNVKQRPITTWAYDWY